MNPYSKKYIPPTPIIESPMTVVDIKSPIPFKKGGKKTIKRKKHKRKKYSLSLKRKKRKA